MYVFISSLHSPDTNSLSVIWMGKIFLHLRGLPPTQLTIPFVVQSFSFMLFHLSTDSLTPVLLECYSESPYLCLRVEVTCLYFPLALSKCEVSCWCPWFICQSVRSLVEFLDPFVKVWGLLWMSLIHMSKCEISFWGPWPKCQSVRSAVEVLDPLEVELCASSKIRI